MAFMNCKLFDIVNISVSQGMLPAISNVILPYIYAFAYAVMRLAIQQQQIMHE